MIFWVILAFSRFSTWPVDLAIFNVNIVKGCIFVGWKTPSPTSVTFWCLDIYISWNIESLKAILRNVEKRAVSYPLVSIRNLYKKFEIQNIHIFFDYTATVFGVQILEVQGQLVKIGKSLFCGPSRIRLLFRMDFDWPRTRYEQIFFDVEKKCCNCAKLCKS